VQKLIKEILGNLIKLLLHSLLIYLVFFCAKSTILDVGLPILCDMLLSF